MVPQLPTERELDALKILWERGPTTVREIWQSLRERDADLAYTSILSLLQSMEQKGLVDHRSAGRAYEYFPRIERASTFQGLAGRFLDQVFDGALDEYLVHALDSRRLTRQQLDELEKMIAEAKRRSAKPSKKGASK